MEIRQKTIHVRSNGQGTYEITGELEAILRASKLQQGLMTVFCCHTSCSLVLMENADPSARNDLEGWLRRLVPEGDPHFTHTYEGPDDMPSHIKMALTRTSETIPFTSGRLDLGVSARRHGRPGLGPQDAFRRGQRPGIRRHRLGRIPRSDPERRRQPHDSIAPYWQHHAWLAEVLVWLRSPGLG